MRTKEKTTNAFGLTSAELECLRLRYDAGFCNKEIAMALNRSVRTAENHFRSAAAKLSAKYGRGKLMLAYREMGNVVNT